MDKVKIALALLKKHHFWVMTGLVVLLSFIGWFLATSKLWAEYGTSKTLILGKFDALTKLNSGERENQKWVDELQKQTDKLKGKVGAAWSQVYTKQKKEVLIWPKVANTKVQEKFENLAPNAKIDVPFRRAYQTYIRDEFPRLLKIVDAKDEHAGKGKLVPGAKEEASDHDYMLVWDPKDQQEIYGKLVSWETTPTSDQVRETQEDLWVYHALLKIIANLNKFSTGPYNAKVKEIHSLLIGSEAATEFQAGMAAGRLEKPAGATNTAPKPGAAALAAATGVNVTPTTPGRYVDEKGNALAEGTPGPAEFKRMPIVMRLVMDQREILRLLVECANSPLPVEVRKLHVSAKKQPKQGQQQANAEKELNSYEMEVEVDGLIYIFNPPDQTKLGGVAAPDAGAAPPAAAAAPETEVAKPEVDAPAAAGGAPPAAAADEKVPAADEPKEESEPGDAAEPGEMEKNEDAPEPN